MLEGPICRGSLSWCRRRRGLATESFHCSSEALFITLTPGSSPGQALTLSHQGLKGVGIHPHPNPLPEGEGACWLVLMLVCTLLPTPVSPSRERGLLPCQ